MAIELAPIYDPASFFKNALRPSKAGESNLQ